MECGESPGAGRHGAVALTGGAQLASPGWDMKLHRARLHIGAIGDTVTLLCLSRWGRSDLSQQFQVLQDNLRREGWCKVSTHRGRWLSELSFPNPHRKRMRWEANTKPQHTEKGVSKRGLPTKLQVEISNACRGDGAGKTEEEKSQFLL